MTKEEMAAGDARAEIINPLDLPIGEICSLQTDAVTLAALERIFDKLALACHDRRMELACKDKGDRDAAKTWRESAIRAINRLPRWAR